MYSLRKFLFIPVVYIDSDVIKELRVKTEKGDRFKPFGMEGVKNSRIFYRQ